MDDRALIAAIMALAEDNATKSRDFGRGYALAIRDVLALLAADSESTGPEKPE
jgi:hypothetical protein